MPKHHHAHPEDEELKPTEPHVTKLPSKPSLLTTTPNWSFVFGLISTSIAVNSFIYGK